MIPRIALRAAFITATLHNELTRLRVDTLDEVVVLHDRPDVLHLRVGTVIDEDEPALVRVRHVLFAVAMQFPLPADRGIKQPNRELSQ
jgi:hypothetical protein